MKMTEKIQCGRLKKEEDDDSESVTEENEDDFASAVLQKRVGGSRSKERDRKSELVLRSTYQIFEWDRNNSGRNFHNVVRYVHIPLVH